MPPSLSGSLPCASAACDDIASAQAKAPASIRFMQSSLDIRAALPAASRCSDHAAWPWGQQATQRRTLSCALPLFPLCGMGLLFEHDLVGNPVPTFPDHAPFSVKRPLPGT